MRQYPGNLAHGRGIGTGITVTVRSCESRGGSLIESVADAGTGRLNVTTRLVYDAIGNITARTDPNGNRTTMG